MRNADVRPADNVRVMRLRHKQRILRCGLQLAHSFCDLLGRCRIAELATKLCQLRGVVGSRPANDYALIASLLSHPLGLLSCEGVPGPLRSSAREARLRRSIGRHVNPADESAPRI